MAREDTRLDSAFIARRLKLRKNLQHRTVLVLGSRAGGLFRSETLYEVLAQYGDPSFGLWQRPRQFSLCHRILIYKDLFSFSEIDAILSTSLDKVASNDADFCLAELVKQGLFDTIISTSVDTLFEQTLSMREMREGRDFEIFAPASDSRRDLPPPEKRTPCQVIKVFGELTREYTIKRGGYMLNRPRLAESLRQKLAGDVLAIGLDPAWDAELWRLIPPQGGTFWFINEEPVEDTSVLYPVIEERSKRGVLVGDDGSYEYFVIALCREFMDSTPLNLGQDTATLPGIQKSGDEPRLLQDAATDVMEIFFSYARADAHLRNQLANHLAGLMREKNIQSWNSLDITGSQKQSAEIERHLKRATVILLLISSDFLASDEIRSTQVQPAMELYRTNKAAVIPILLRPVDWKNTEFGKLQPLPDNNVPVTQWTNRDRAFLNIADGIRRVIEESTNNS